MKGLLFIILFGCTAKHRFAGKDFESSNSLCLDALAVNMAADGCKNITADPDEVKKILKIYCADKHVDGNSPWLNHFFYFSRASTETSSVPGILMCRDGSLMMTYQPMHTDSK